ncbi:MAG: PAS domain S-box protein, partial [Bacteroidales bacterium]|nr:PAS domain S-box protein [Bacteroidales bacterium]
MDDRLKQLREKAELILNDDENKKPDIPRGDFNRIIQELKVYQIELELQNEELREAQKSLEESRNSYAQLYNQAPAGYVTLSKNSMILQANQTFLNMVNQDLHNVVNASLAEFIAENDRKTFLSRFNAFFKKPVEKSIELTMMKKGGKPFFVRISGGLKSDNLQENKTEIMEPRLFLIIIDISREKKFEASLIESENNYRTLANTGQALIWGAGTDKLCNYFNDVWLNFTGRTLEKELGNGWAEGVHPEDLDRCVETYVNAFDKREKFSMEYRLRRHDGVYRWLQDDGAPRYNSDGDFVGYIGFCLDIDESKKNKIQLAESEQKYKKLSAELEAILDHIPGLVFYKDTQNNFIRVNKFIADAHNKHKSELEGINLSKLYPPEIARHYWDDDLKVINSGIPILNLEEQWDTSNGSKWVSTSKIPFFDEEGRVVGVIGISMDITTNKQNKEELALKNKELSKLNVQKDKFFSIIAHDLKSPFNSIVGFSELLIESAKSKEIMGIEKYAQIIYQSSVRAMDLLMNLMEWARSQTGLMEFNPEYFELITLIDEIKPMFDDIAGQKSVSISKILPPNAPVFADKAMISTILRNLISNAIKFSYPGGEITIKVEENKNELTVSVSDNGVGISKNNIEK